MIRAFLRRRHWAVLLSCALCVLALGVTLGWNQKLSEIINVVSAGSMPERSVIIPALIFIVLNVVLQFGQNYCSGWTCELMAHDLRMSFARHISRLSLRDMESMNAGEQMSLIQNELNEVSAFLRDNLFSMFSDAVCFTITFAWLLVLNPSLTLLSNLPTLPVLIYTIFSSKKISRLTTQSQQANAGMGAFTDALVMTMPVLKVFDASRMLAESFQEKLNEWEAITIRSERVKAVLMSLSGVMGYLPLVALFMVGGQQVLAGSATIGEVYIFVNLSGNVSGVLMNLPSRIAGYRRFRGNLDRLNNKLDPEPDTKGE